jgi:cytidine deaminase
MRKVDLQIFVEIYPRPELSDADQTLFREAREATRSSYSPYSGFCVGAALRLEDGTIMQGSNQENAAFPSGLCAERTAVFSAAVQHPGKRIEAIAIVACPAESRQFVPISPCGGCRQVLLEYEQKQGSRMRVLMDGENDQVTVFPSAAALLPNGFSAEHLQ